MSNEGDNRAIATIISAARDAVRRERHEHVGTIMQSTRRSFRPTPSTRGRRRNMSWKRPIFLLRRSNTDFYPSSIECSFLKQHGLGKVTGVIERNWSINRLQRYIYQLYPHVPLEDTGFHFAKCDRNKKILILATANTVTELENFVARSVLLIVPDRDIVLEGLATTNNSHNNLPEVSSRSSTLQYNDIYNRIDNEISSDDDFTSRPVARPRRDQDSSVIDFDTNNTGATDSQFLFPRLERTNVEFSVRENSDVSLLLSEEETDGTEYSSTNNGNVNDIEFPTLLENSADEVFSVGVKRECILNELLEIYKNETVTQRGIKVVFKDEMGLDYGGLTKELFTEFWKQCEIEFFRGEDCIVPYIPLSKVRKGQGEHFTTIGRILAHTLLLTRSVPLKLSRCLYLKLGDLERKIPASILEEDFFNFVTTSERFLLKKAKSSFSSLTNSENDILIDFFQTYGLLENPKESEISEQILIIAENVLCRESLDFIKKIKDGIPLFCENFFVNLTIENLTTLFKHQAPTAAKVIKCLVTSPDELNSLQSRTFYFFKTYIKNLASADLLKLLLFTTGSQHMPENITVHFKSFGQPVAHTCSNTIEVPSIYSTHQELSREFNAILNSEHSFEYSLL